MNSVEYEAASKAMGNTTKLTTASRIALRQAIATEDLAAAIRENAVADRVEIDKTREAALALAPLKAA